MVTVREVSGAKDIKEFIEFPLRLYKDCVNFIPPLYGDEKKLLKSGGNSDNAESAFFLAEKDGGQDPRAYTASAQFKTQLPADALFALRQY